MRVAVCRPAYPVEWSAPSLLFRSEIRHRSLIPSNRSPARKRSNNSRHCQGRPPIVASRLAPHPFLGGGLDWGAVVIGAANTRRRRPARAALAAKLAAKPPDFHKRTGAWADARQGNSRAGGQPRIPLDASRGIWLTPFLRPLSQHRRHSWWSAPPVDHQLPTALQFARSPRPPRRPARRTTTRQADRRPHAAPPARRADTSST
jgi:hypothetical protein